MKKVMVSIMVLSWMAMPAMAQKNKHRTSSCPAATCTDHSYDRAYSAMKESRDWTETRMVEKKDCPAATCTDHSYDQAYNGSMQYNERSTSIGRRDMIPVPMPSQAWVPDASASRGNAYSMSDYTIFGRYNRNSMSAPYYGEDAPSYDGAAKNAYRNMRANNEAEPLPASNGK